MGLPRLLARALKQTHIGRAFDDVRVSPVLAAEGRSLPAGLYFVVAKDIVKGPAGRNEIVGFIVDFDWIMRRFVAPLQTAGSTFAWVMNRDGRLLFHPRHPEMVLRSIFEEDRSCSGCHEDFAPQAALLARDNEFGTYQVSNEPAKVMAQASVKIANLDWRVFVSTDVREITGVVRKNFALFFWLVGFFTLGIVVAAVALIQLNRRRARAEAFAQYLQEREEIQEQLAHASQLASVGELVDSVAHEMNTPLGVMSASVEDLLLRASDSENAAILELLRKQVWRMSTYTQRLLRFSRRMKFEPRSTDVVSMVDECLALLAHRFRANKVESMVYCPQTMPPILLDPDQMQRGPAQSVEQCC